MTHNDMKTAMLLKQYESAANRRKLLLTKLIEQQERIQSEINSILGEDAPIKKTAQPRATRPVGRTKFSFPRGVLTLAAFNAIKKAKKPLKFKEVLNEVKKQEGINPDSDTLEKSLYNLLNSSPRFIKQNGFFDVATDGLSGKLFERLALAS